MQLVVFYLYLMFYVCTVKFNVTGFYGELNKAISSKELKMHV